MVQGYHYYDFEKPVEELERRIAELRRFADPKSDSTRLEMSRLERKLPKAMAEVYSNLTRWQKTLISRHPHRPYSLDYIGLIFSDFVELHGDRTFMDDSAVVGGMAWLKGEPVMVMGQQKGRSTQDKIQRNFGMPHPEGYRKALRLMKLAEKFSRPIVTLIDTPGAYPGIEAEERGQAQAIARNIMEMAALRVPVVSAVIGEGGSGGALAIGVADRVLMMEHAIYSVISPEGCAAILWRDATKNEAAAEALRLTAQDALQLGVIDGIVPEPLGGAHRDYDQAASAVGTAIRGALGELQELSTEALLTQRYQKLRRFGAYRESI